MSASSSHVNEEFVLFERPEGVPSENTFKKQSLAYPDVNQLKDGQVIAKLLFASVDPYMRGVIKTSTVGVVHYGLGVAEVVESKSAQWKAGDLFFDGLPWRRYSIVDIDRSKFVIRIDSNLLKSHHLSPSIYLSALGMVARTAYFGVRDVLQIHPKYLQGKDITVVISGAAGATGGFAIQYARLFGAKKIIGIAGGKDKCDYVVKELGADAAIDYKEYNTAASIRKRLEELAPQGIDRYFDNTGGIATEAILNLITKFARIAVCGQISEYNVDSSSPVLVPSFLGKLIYKSATIQGFLVQDFVHLNEEFFEDSNKWLKEGKIKDKQYIVNGFEQIPKAFLDLFTGANTGKVIIDCSK